MLQSVCCKMFDHLLHSAKLSLCDFHMFSPLKYSGLVVLEQQPSVLFVEGIHQLVYQCDVYLSAPEHYI